MKKPFVKYLAFGSLAVLIVMMMAATILERLQGTDQAFRLVYHNPLFIAIWAVLAVSGLCWLLNRKVQKHFFTLMLHASFAVILLGALVTFLWGRSGEIHLRSGEPSSVYELEDGRTVELPFSLELKQFRMEFYKGSKMPSDYASELVCLDGNAREDVEISMNHIFKHRGYRFYQADFDPDMQGSILAVSHDPWGVGITYAGYLLLLVSMIGFFFQRSSGFRAALARLAAAAVLLLVLLPQNARAAARTEDPKVLPKEVAAHFGELYVYYNNRIAPLQTQARDYCLKAYGKAHWGSYSAEQVLTGWLFYPDWWKAVPFKVKAKDRGTDKEQEKHRIFENTASGDALKLFPVAVTDTTGSVSVNWYNCDEPLPEALFEDYDQWVFIRRVLDLVAESVRAEDWAEVDRILGKIKTYQEKTAAGVLPSPRHIRAERFYNRISRPMVPFMASITLGLILFVLSGIWLSKGRRTPRGLQTVLAVLSGILLVYLTLVLGLRWYVSGHMPFSGSYCVMLLMAWFSSLAMLLLYRKFPLVQPLGFLLAGFTMLMASLSSANPQITHLMPVLQSPLLSIHVLSMMMSYTLFGLAALNGVMGLFVPAGRQTLRDVSLVVLYPGVFLLIFGTFLGAVWANISWGSYWAWDPKETWALITILVYSFALHGGSLKVFRNPTFFHIYAILAFLSVLITYFGVNLILGGMHAYA